MTLREKVVYKATQKLLESGLHVRHVDCGALGAEIADSILALLSTADSEQREVRDRDAVLNEALDRIAYLTDSGSFHGYRSEVWCAVGRVYDAALSRPAEQQEALIELQHIDEVMARRPALADCKTRIEKIELAISTAKRTEAAEAEVADLRRKLEQKK